MTTRQSLFCFSSLLLWKFFFLLKNFIFGFSPVVILSTSKLLYKEYNFKLNKMINWINLTFDFRFAVPFWFVPLWLASLTACLISSTKLCVTRVGSLECGLFKSLKSPELSLEDDISFPPRRRSLSARTCFSCSANDAGGPVNPAITNRNLHF